jgi:hypothetical protein
LASSVAAQDTSRTGSLDSLLAQLRRAESRIDILEKQVAAQAESGIRTRSGMKAEISGRVLVNGFYNSRRVNNVDNPQFARPDTSPEVPVRGLGMSPRQSVLRLAVAMPDVAGGEFSGDLDVDFYGGQQPSSGGRTFPLVRLRTVNARIRWSRGELAVGQDVPLISPVNPVSVASIGTPSFATAGNLWLWLPQLRATIETSTRIRLGFQAAVLAPTSGDAVGLFDTDFDAAERSRRPYLQTRIRARWGDQEAGGEMGCGAHLGWIATNRGAAPTGGSDVRTHAVACDLATPLAGWLEVRGEVFVGQALRGLGGGGVGQGLGLSNRPVSTRGGWGQLVVAPGISWSATAGCGIDDPRDSDLTALARRENVACAAAVRLAPFDPVFVAVEGRRIATRYASGRVANDHLNIAVGFDF